MSGLDDPRVPWVVPAGPASKEVDPTGGFLRTPIPIVSPHPLGVGGGIEHGEFSFGEDEPPRGVARVGLSRFGNKMIRPRRVDLAFGPVLV